MCRGKKYVCICTCIEEAKQKRRRSRRLSQFGREVFRPAALLWAAVGVCRLMRGWRGEEEGHKEHFIPATLPNHSRAPVEHS